MNDKKKWYETNTVIILTLILFFPIGLWLLWKSDWDKKWKWAITILIVIIVIINAASSIKEKSNSQISPASSTADITKAKQSPIANPREVTSLHQAYIGHWKMEGENNNEVWTDYYVTDSSSKLGNMIEATYNVISEEPTERTMYFVSIERFIGVDVPPTTFKNEIVFSEDYKSAVLEVITDSGLVKHRLRYIEQ